LSASLLAAWLAVACSGGGSGPEEGTIAGLCRARQQAAADREAAESTYLERSQEGVHQLVRSLEPAYRVLAGQVARAVQRVEADFDRGAPTLGEDLATLTELSRNGFARLAIETKPCKR
jgi:hypothetical protein